MSNNIPNIKIKIFVSLFFIWMFLTNSVFSQYQLQEAFPNLSFSNPLFLTNSGDGSNRIFVVEQAGVIKVFPNNSSVSTAKVFLAGDHVGRPWSNGGCAGVSLQAVFHFAKPTG